jgi:hypothetical protein
MKREDRKAIAAQNSFGNELPEARPIYILHGNIRPVAPQTVVSYFKPEPSPTKPTGGYNPLGNLIRCQEGLIEHGGSADPRSPAAQTDRSSSLVRYRPSGLFRRERYYLTLDATQVAVFCPPPRSTRSKDTLDPALSQTLFVGSGNYDRRVMLLPEFSDRSIGAVGRDMFRFTAGNHVVSDILCEEGIAMLLDAQGNPSFFGHDCRVRPISVDECSVSAGNKKGYFIFRIRRNCLALFNPVGDDGDPTLFTEKGIYVLPEKEISRLVIHDLNNPTYRGGKELKVLHLMPNAEQQNQSVFYYSKEILARFREQVSGGLVHVVRGEKIPLATRQGIQIIYDPEDNWEFQSDPQSGDPITHSYTQDSETLPGREDSYSIAKFSHQNLALVAVRIPNNNTLYYIESYGDSQVVKLRDDEDIPSVDNIDSLPIRADMAYVRHTDSLFFVHLKRRECKKLDIDAAKIASFDLLVNPPSFRGRGLTDRELDEIEKVIEHPIQKNAVFDYFKGGSHQIVYNPALVELEVASRTCGETQGREVIHFAQFTIVQIPFNHFAITKLQAKAKTAVANEYGRESDLRVYTSGSMLINSNVERLIDMWPMTQQQIECEVDARTRNHLSVKVKVVISSRVVDAVKSIVPQLTENFTVAGFFDKVLQVQLRQQIVHIAKQVFIKFVSGYTYEELQRDLKSVSGGAHQAMDGQSRSDGVLLLQDLDHNNERELMQQRLEREIEEKAQAIGLGTSSMSYRIDISDLEMKEKLEAHLAEIYDEDHKLQLAVKKHLTAEQVAQTEIAKIRVTDRTRIEMAQNLIAMSVSVDPNKLDVVKEVVDVLGGKGRTASKKQNKRHHLGASNKRNKGTSVVLVQTSGGVAHSRKQDVDSSSEHSSDSDREQKPSLFRENKTSSDKSASGTFSNR